MTMKTPNLKHVYDFNHDEKSTLSLQSRNVTPQTLIFPQALTLTQTIWFVTVF